MQANELRIGNYVQTIERQKAAYGKNLAFVTGILEDKFTVCNHYPGSWFEPIPLNEEWLNKFGFKFWGWNKQCAGLQINDLVEFEIDFDLNSFCVVYNDMKVEGEHSSMQLDIKYVHQLQNLYFALTNTELEIK